MGLASHQPCVRNMATRSPVRSVHMDVRWHGDVDVGVLGATRCQRSSHTCNTCGPQSPGGTERREVRRGRGTWSARAGTSERDPPFECSRRMGLTFMSSCTEVSDAGKNSTRGKWNQNIAQRDRSSRQSGDLTAQGIPSTKGCNV